MKQPKVFSRQQLITAALDIIRESGRGALTARSLAKKIGCSTMPIYSNMKSIGELEEEVREQVRLLLKDHQRKEYTPEPLLNLAFGYITFARDEGQLFRFLYQESEGGVAPKLTDFRSRFFQDFGPESPEGKALLEMDPDAQENLILNTWIFTHGLAMLVNSGTYLPEDEEILSRLRAAGEAFYLQELRSNASSREA